MNGAGAGFGIYIHWPFCAAKCPYCDFNSHVRAEINHQEWCNALISELRYYAALTPNRTVNTVFFGGGTPSLMAPETVGEIIAEIQRNWQLANDAEITLEANPTSVEAGKFRAFAQAGVNRLSMGVQSLLDEDLRALGRMHSAQEARDAFDIAKQHFENVSFDLIYARQNQSLVAWEAELNEAIAMAVDHLSLYQLTIEQGTAFGALYDKGRLRGLPSDDLAADMYELTQRITESSGLDAYEVSNHARAGRQSQHNLIYWRYGDYLGIGPGAHGRFTHKGERLSTIGARAPETWLTAVKSAGHGQVERQVIALTDQAEEYAMMSLRLSEGLDIARFNNFSSLRLNRQVIERNVEMGFLHASDDRLFATPKGRMILNRILADLLVM